MQETNIPSNALASVPNSLKSQLERAQNLLNQSEHAASHGDHSLAMLKARSAMKVLRSLAASSPAHAAILQAAEMGYRGYRIDTYERIDRYQTVDRKFLGITIGTDVVNTPTITHRAQIGRVL
jgi:hypothetical protein